MPRGNLPPPRATPPVSVMGRRSMTTLDLTHDMRADVMLERHVAANRAKLVAQSVQVSRNRRNGQYARKKRG